MSPLIPTISTKFFSNILPIFWELDKRLFFIIISIILEPIAISILLPPPHVLERTPDSVGSYFLSYTVVYTEDIYNDKDNPVITAERGYIIGDKAYTFQYARNNQSTFASYLPIVDDMINSFELIRSTEN